MKTMTLLLDGLGDRSYEKLGWKTPLQYADTPFFDCLSEMAQCGMMIPYRHGVPLSTDLAHFIMFGYDMAQYPGRAIIDALGDDIPFEREDIVLRTSWADVEVGQSYLLNERFTKDLTRVEAEELASALPKTFMGARFKWYFSHDSHGYLVVSGENLSEKISDADPFYKPQHVMKVEAFETDDLNAVRTADLISGYLRTCSGILEDHPINKERRARGQQVANFLMTKWTGKQVEVDSFYEQNGMTGALIGHSKLLKGLCRLIDMDYIDCEDFGEAVDLGSKGQYDYVHVHTKAPDVASHKKDPLKKVQVIEALDTLIGRKLSVKPDLLIVTGDHSTPCGGEMIHSGDQVPILFHGDLVMKDSVNCFDEPSCSLGSLTIQGGDFMPLILNFTDRAKMFHLKSGTRRRLYTPDKIKKL